MAGFVWRRGLLAHDVVVQTAGFSVIALAAGAVLGGAVSAPPGSRWARLFRHPVLRFFGRYSYGIYVYQGLVRYAFWAHVPFVQRLPFVAGVQAFAALGVLLVGATFATAAAVVSYELFERPILRLKERVPYDGHALRRDTRRLG